MNEPPNQSLQWIAASRRPLSFIVSSVIEKTILSAALSPTWTVNALTGN